MLFFLLENEQKQKTCLAGGSETLDLKGLYKNDVLLSTEKQKLYWKFYSLLLRLTYLNGICLD